MKPANIKEMCIVEINQVSGGRLRGQHLANPAAVGNAIGGLLRLPMLGAVMVGVAFIGVSTGVSKTLSCMLQEALSKKEDTCTIKGFSAGIGAIGATLTVLPIGLLVNHILQYQQHPHGD